MWSGTIDLGLFEGVNSLDIVDNDEDRAREDEDQRDDAQRPDSIQRNKIDYWCSDQRVRHQRGRTREGHTFACGNHVDRFKFCMWASLRCDMRR